MPGLSTEDQDGVMKLFQQYGEAWARRDAPACAALFAADADLIAADGEVCAGPAAIESYYARQLSGPYKDLTVTDMESTRPARLVSKRPR
jgi:uncharacterized protein (TIGR02246 family)